MTVMISSAALKAGHMPQGTEGSEDKTLNQRRAMDAFLAGIERRGYQMARLATGDSDAALDLVQEAMIKLVSKYADKPEADWQPLFFRILKNKIIDHQRRGSVRNRVIAWFRPDADGDVYDAVAAAKGPGSDTPERQVESQEAMTALESAIKELPARQQQVFLLRTIEGMDVAETAEVMGCSQGSVKTHLSRATAKLRDLLGDHY